MKNRKREICTSGSVRDEDGQPPHLLGRRKFLPLAAGATVLPALSRIASAQAYPSRPVRFVVGSPPGGQPDIIARVMGQWLSDRFGQPFIIENRQGAAGNIAAEAVTRAPADGYTLVNLTASHAISAACYEKLNYSLIRDIARVASVIRIPIVLVVHPSFPAKTVPEFIAYAKDNPGKTNIASASIGSGPYMAAALFKMMTGVDMVQVPYRGDIEGMTDLFGGQVQAVFSGITPFIENIRAGKLRALAVTTAQRLETFPDIPTVGASVPGYEASGWFGIGAPKATPAEIIDRLNKEINAGLTDPKIKARLADLIVPVLALSPSEFGKFIVDETEKWGKVVRTAGIKAE
jgi:tripartite-type tricarboxylate transporter receptor subunit TctC